MAATGVRRGIATWSQLTDEQKMLRDMCRTFADEELKPNAGMWDQKHMFPADAVKAMGEMGLLGVAQDDKYGGAGMDAMSYAIAVEEISRGCASAGVIMSAQNSLYCEPVGELSHPSWSLCTTPQTCLRQDTPEVATQILISPSEQPSGQRSSFPSPLQTPPGLLGRAESDRRRGSALSESTTQDQTLNPSP
jgi:hypothetical protein